MGKYNVKLRRVNAWVWDVAPFGGMNVPARVYADEKLLKLIESDNALEQAINVAFLPGIVGRSLAMPDAHWGYGFPIGGVAATDPDAGGVISPGGIGFDINCGVRAFRTDLTERDVKQKIDTVVSAIFHAVPVGVGSEKAIHRLSDQELDDVMRRGAGWAVEQGFGTEEDLRRTEEGGCLAGAEPANVSRDARSRGMPQMGTLGSGNHFIEIDVVDEVYNAGAAEAFGIERGGIVIQIHCGSRGFGHQVCSDALKYMQRATEKYGFDLPDKQLACAPLDSDEGKRYFSAMASAANYAWANRQTIMHLTAQALGRVFDGDRVARRTPPRHAGDRDSLGIRLIYDVCHNIAKFETHEVGGEQKRVCVHRKGATRAFPPGHAQVPAVYRETGQPVLIPGDMGTCSFICVGTPKAMEETFGSSCHGAGRTMSRHAAKKAGHGRNIARELAGRGITVKCQQRSILAEEMSEAYKDVEDVVEVMCEAGVTRRVARLRPIGVVKG